MSVVEDGLRFEVLGELRALRTGVAVPLTPKQGQLLGCLLLARGEAVGAARLCELLWGEASWRTAADRDRDRDNLHHHVVRLRDKLDPAGDARESRSPAAANGGYLLEVDDDRLDALRFTRWLREGRAAARRQDWHRAAERLRAALGLWHGPRALADLRAAGWDHEGAEELDRERAAARLEVIAIEVTQLHRAHLPELEWLVGTDLTSARTTELLLRALHGRGERDAIERAYLRYSDAVTEADWRVDADLTGLYHRMRNGEEPRGRTEDRPPGGNGGGEGRGRRRLPGEVFVGREEELAQLHGALGDAREGQGSLLWVSGGPGIGKRTLASVFTGEARALGVDVIRQRLRVLSESQPNGAFSRVLDDWLALARDPADVARLLGPEAGLLSARPLAAEVSDRTGEDPATPSPPRADLADALAAVLRRSASDRPLVLVLEELQYASPLTRMLVAALAERIEETPLLVLGLYSDRLSDQRAELDELLATLPRSHRSTKLRGLSVDDVRVLLATAFPAEVSDLLAAPLQLRTAGNPHFVTEVLRGLRQGAQPSDGPAELLRRLDDDVPEEVQRTTRWRLAELEPRVPGVSRMLEAACVIGREFDLPLLRRVTELEDVVLLALLRHAIATDFIEPIADTAGFRFLHALERDAIHLGLKLLPAEHAQLHLRAGCALEQLPAGSHRQLAMIAHHFEEASLTAEGAAKALRYLCEAGDEARARLAFEDAAQHYTEALRRVQEPGERCALLLRLAAVRFLAEDPDGAQPVYLKAAELARTLGAAHEFAHATLGLGKAFSYYGVGTSGLVELLEEALERLGPDADALRAEVLGRLAVAHYWVDPALHTRRAAEREQLSAEALRVARTLDDPQVLLAALDARSHSICGPEPHTHDERVGLADELVDTALRSRNKVMSLQGRTWRIVHLLEHGDTARLDEERDEYGRVARRLGRTHLLFWVEVWQGMREASEARFAAAEDAVGRARKLADRLRHAALLHHSVDVAQFYLRYVQGREAEVTDIVTRAAAWAPGLLAWRLPLILTHLAAGRRDEAETAFRRFVDTDLDRLPRDAVHVATLGLLAEVCARLADADRAAVLYERLRGHESLHIAVGFASASDGPVAHYLGRLAVLLGRPEDAVAHLERAVALAEASGGIVFRLRSQVELGGVLLRHPTRWSQGRELVVDASKAAALHDLVAIESRAEALLDGA